MKTFEINLFDDHCIINENNQIILIDTGCPASLSRTGQLSFMDKEWQVNTTFLGNNLDNISELVGTKIDAMVGTDIISKYCFLFDYKNKKLTVSEHIAPMEDSSEIQNYGGKHDILLNLGIGDKKMKMFFDTGAKISYLNHLYTQEMTPSEESQDFYLGYGAYSTPIFPIETAINEDTAFTVKYGNLPHDLGLEQRLSAMGIEGIIGSDLFYNFQVLTDLPNYKIYIKKNK